MPMKLPALGLNFSMSNGREVFRLRGLARGLVLAERRPRGRPAPFAAQDRDAARGVRARRVEGAERQRVGGAMPADEQAQRAVFLGDALGRALPVGVDADGVEHLEQPGGEAGVEERQVNDARRGAHEAFARGLALRAGRKGARPAAEARLFQRGGDGLREGDGLLHVGLRLPEARDVRLVPKLPHDAAPLEMPDGGDGPFRKRIAKLLRACARGERVFFQFGRQEIRKRNMRPIFLPSCLPD